MRLQLVKKVDEAKNTKSFFFKSDTPVSWLPGQYIYIILPKLNYEDQRGDTRHFTIASSPTEGELLRITTRVRKESGYKKTLDELEIGSFVEGKDPQGTFILDKQSLPLRGEKNKTNVYIAGGIGITPFRAMIKYNIDKNLKIPMHLIYSNSDSEFVFKNELDKWQSENSHVKVTYFDSSLSGHLDQDKLKTLCTDDELRNNTFWIVGPNVFVDTMEEILEVLNIKEVNMKSTFAIKTEKFTGY